MQLIEERAVAMSLSPQELEKVLKDSLPVEMQEQVIMMRAHAKTESCTWSWEEAKNVFLSLTGLTATRTKHGIMREFVTRAIKQLPEQTVTQYCLAFETK
jgi:hypothetical protein